MNFPSKVTPYNLSSFPLMVLILNELEASPMTPSDLLASRKIKRHSMHEIIDALDALFALGKIDFDNNGLRLRYVG